MILFIVVVDDDGVRGFQPYLADTIIRKLLKIIIKVSNAKRMKEFRTLVRDIFDVAMMYV
jgi:hypothetical protein